MSFSPNETPSKLSYLEVEIDIQESAGSGSGVLVRMLRLTVIGHGSGHASSIGAGGHRDISAGRGVPRTRIGPTLYASPNTVTVLLLQLHLD